MTKRRTGSIYPERDRRGGFTGRWIREETVDGGRRVRTRHATMEDAMRKPEKVHVATLGDLHAQAEAILWKGTKDELQSQQRWRTCLGLLGKDTYIAAVRKPQLETLARDLGREGRGPKTINRYMATVSRALRWAHESDLIEGMPAIPWQKEAEGRKVFLPEHLTEAFLAAIPEPYRFGAEVLLMSGMRVSELLSLDTYEVIEDVVHLSDTKTGRPRNIPMPQGYGSRIQGWLSHSKPVYRDFLRHIKSGGAAVGVGGLTPHALRHTTATRLIARGVPSLTVAEIMGHSSLATTRQYTHHEVESLRKAIASISLRSDGAIGDREECKTLINKEGGSPEGICSPLRSHSATRP